MSLRFYLFWAAELVILSIVMDDSSMLPTALRVYDDYYDKYFSKLFELILPETESLAQAASHACGFFMSCCDLFEDNESVIR